MSKTLEVEFENGQIRSVGKDILPNKGHGLLMLFKTGQSEPARTCAELATRWATRQRLDPAEAGELADDIERGRAQVLPLKSAWE